jgi:hypothetical protein
MPRRIYTDEREYRSAILRDNETRKAVAAVYLQLGVALVAGMAARWYMQGPSWYVATWNFSSAFLIIVGLLYLRSLEAEG